MKDITSCKEFIQHMISQKVTMVGPNCFDTVLRNYDVIEKVEGDMVECGVWRGGFSIFLSHTFPEKTMWVCDSYEGFQPLENAKHQYSKERHTPSYTHGAVGPLAISLEEVKSHFKDYGLEDNSRIKFLKGFVKDTLPTSGIEKISLLRIDVDAYSATLEVLEELYDKVEDKGWVIFDDSSLYESLDAIKYFFNIRNIPPFIHHPVTGDKLDLNIGNYSHDNSGFPAGCYIIKNQH